MSGRVSRHQAERAAAQQTVEQPDAPVAAGPPPTQGPSGGPSGGLTDEALSALERLGKLREQGVLTDTEFAVQKDRILRG